MLRRACCLLVLAAAAAAQQPPAGPPRAGPDPPPPDGVPAIKGAQPTQPEPPPEPPAPLPRPVPPSDVGAGQPYVQDIAGTVITIPMRPVAPGLWFSATEVTWDAYDVLVFGLDKPGDGASLGADGAANEEVRGADAVLRPTHPHMVTDRGWGHAGFPAMSLSARGAQAFCEWLSASTGRRYRLPSEAEWEAACRAGAPPGAAWSCGDDVAALAGIAWFRENSERRTHAVGGKAPNVLGLFDLHGNVGEWCVAPDGGCVVRGGSYRDPSKDLRCDARLLPVPAWNQSDPNLPRSVWWLADAPFVGFRIACEGEPDAQGAPRPAAK